MSLNSYNKIKLTDFRGLYDRGDREIVPLSHFSDCLNIDYELGKFKTRSGTSLFYTPASGLARRNFAQLSTDGGVLAILSIDGLGRVYEESVPPAPPLSTLLGTIVGANDFSVVQYFSHLFICPRNGSQGIGNMYVFNFLGTPRFRQAAGAHPTTGVTAVNGAAGRVPAGTYKISYSLVTDTGFITPPAPLATYVSPGNVKIDLTGIITGGTQVVQRLILITKNDELELFFVPSNDGGIINDNVTTTATIDFDVTDLQESADYLNDLFEDVPSGTGLLVYNSRLMSWGFPSPDGSLARGSRAGEPESFDQTNCNIVVARDDGYNVKSCCVLRNVFYPSKDRGIYSVIDNDGEPSDWDFDIVDRAIGAFSVRAISLMQPNHDPGSHNDLMLVGDNSGLYIFNGVVNKPQVTFKVEDLWRNRVDFEVFSSIVVDTARKLVYVCGLDVDGNGFSKSILVGNFQEGIGIEETKWSIWKFPLSVINIGLLDSSVPPDVILILADGRWVKLDDSAADDLGVKIDTIAELGPMSFDDSFINLFTQIKLRAVGTGILQTSLTQSDNGNKQTLSKLLLQDKPGRDLTVQSNLMAERAWLKMECVDGVVEVSKPLTLFGKQKFKERPR